MYTDMYYMHECVCACIHVSTYMGTVSTIHPLSAHSTLLNYCMVRMYKYTCNHTEILCLCFLWSFVIAHKYSLVSIVYFWP